MSTQSLVFGTRQVILVLLGLLITLVLLDVYILEDSIIGGGRGADEFASKEVQEQLLQEVEQLKRHRDAQVSATQKDNQDTAASARLAALVSEQSRELEAQRHETKQLQEEVAALEGKLKAAKEAKAALPVAVPTPEPIPDKKEKEKPTKEPAGKGLTLEEKRKRGNPCSKDCDVTQPDTGRKYLVFSSVGDFSHAEFWLDQGSNRTFDVIVAYYGDKDEWAMADKVDHVFHRKDGKFGNTQWLALNHPDVFLSYDAVFVMDDDIQITSQDINTLFTLRRCYQLDMAAPGFQPYHRSFKSIERQSPHDHLRLVQFVEMNAPMFEAQFLYNWLVDEFDPIIVGWGADVWYVDYLKRKKGVMAVADQVRAENPLKHDNGKREIDVLQPESTRAKKWGEYARTHHLPVSVPHVAYSKVDGSHQHIVTSNGAQCFDAHRANHPQAIVVGLPGNGESRIAEYFTSAKWYVSQTDCVGKRTCSQCFMENKGKSREPFYNCGYADIHTGLVAFTGIPSTCFHFDTERLNYMHKHHPDVTLILNTQNDWVASLASGIGEKIRKCGLKNVPAEFTGTESELKELHTSYVQSIREWINSHPSHKLIEMNIDDTDAFNVLTNLV